MNKVRNLKIWKVVDRQVIYYSLMLFASMIPNMINLLSPELSWTARILNIFLPLGVYLMLFSFTRKTGYSVFYMFPVLFLSAFQLVIFCLNRETVISVDMWLNLTTTNSGEVYELLHSLLVALFLVAIIYLPVISLGIFGIIFKWRTPQPTLLKMRFRATVSLLISSLLVLVASISGQDVSSRIFPLNALSNLVKAIEANVHISNYHETSADFTFHAVKPVDTDDLKELYIIVIGETSRADNWELLGYERPTNGPLKDLRGLVMCPRVLSQSNTTHKSVPLLLSHLDAGQYGDSIYRVKSLVTAFKEAGFNTAFFSSQQKNHSYIDFFGQEADTCVFINENPSLHPSRHDLALVELMEKELHKGHKRQLIVLHSYGSHFNYNERYSDDSRLFVPDEITSVGSESRKELLNAYDNTIVATSRFLRAAIDAASNSDYKVASLIYTSDHGEDIYDDGSGRFLHASAVPSYYQLHVPLLIWFSDDYRKSYPEIMEKVESNKGHFISSSASLFHTSIGIAGIQTPYYRKNLSLTSEEYKAPRPLFLNDRNVALPVEKSGISNSSKEKVTSLLKGSNR